MKTFIVHPFEQVLGVTTDIKEFLQHEEKYIELMLEMGLVDHGFIQSEEKDVKNCLGMTIYFEYGKKPFVKFVVYIAPHKVKDVSLRFHESLHAAHYIMQHCRQPIDFDSTEIQAYMMEYISENIKKLLGTKD